MKLAIPRSLGASQMAQAMLNFCATCWNAQSGWRCYVGAFIGALVFFAGLIAIGLIGGAVKYAFQFVAAYLMLHPLALVAVLYLGLFLLGLVALYVVVRVIRAAWRHGS